MTLSKELDDVVTDLAFHHPHFPRVTIERLVRRTAEELRGTLPTGSLVTAVRREAAEQLDYADDPPREATAS